MVEPFSYENGGLDHFKINHVLLVEGSSDPFDDQAIARDHGAVNILVEAKQVPDQRHEAACPLPGMRRDQLEVRSLRGFQCIKSNKLHAFCIKTSLLLGITGGLIQVIVLRQ